MNPMTLTKRFVLNQYFIKYYGWDYFQLMAHADWLQEGFFTDLLVLAGKFLSWFKWK